MAVPRGMGKNNIARKKATRPKARTSKAAIGAPTGDTPSNPPSTPDLPSVPSTPPSTPPSDSGGRRYEMPKSYDQDFTPVGIPDDSEWHLDYPIAQIQVNSKAKHPMDVVRFWTQNDSERLKRAEPYGADGRFTIGPEDMSGPPGLLTSEKYKKAQREGAGYVPPDGMEAPKSTSKPRNTRNTKETKGSYSVETIRNVPGSYATGVTNGMTNRDKYVR